MLGIIPLYFIGKYFSELAHDYNRSRWGYAILAIVAYIFVQLLLNVGLLFLIADNPNMDAGSSIFISLLGIGGGVVFIWLFYRWLKNKWENQPAQNNDSDLLDDQL